MTLILPKPDPDLLPSGPTGLVGDAPGQANLPEFRESADYNAPDVSWASDCVKYDETVAVFGDELSSVEFVLWNGSFQTITPIRSTTDKAQFVMPQGVDQGVLIWPKDFSGYGRPFRLNSPEVHWVYPGKKWTALTDRTIRIFGRNLKNAAVYYQIGSGSASTLEVQSSTDNEIVAVLPLGYTAGTYYVWCHGGSLGEYGWSDSASFTVAANTYTYATAVTVDSQAGATDQLKIEAAITAAGSNGTVTFAARTYTVTAQINVGAAVKLKGAGVGDTILSAATEVHLYCTGAGVIIEDMTLQGLPISFRNVDPTARRLHATSNYTSGPISFYSASAPSQTQRQVINSVIEDCTLVHEGGGITLAHTGHYIARCEFFGNYQGNVYASVGGSSATGSVTNINAIRTYSAHNVLVEDCYASSYDAENDVPLNRFVLMTYSCDTNHVYKNNIIDRNGAFGETTDAETNSGETFCLHGVDGGLLGTVVSATDTTVVIDGTDIVGEDLGSSVGADAITLDVLYAAVLSGRAKGQVRLIDSASEGGGDTTLTVSKWRLQPEVGDKVAIRPRFTRIIIDGNTVDSVPDGRSVIFYRSGVTLWQVSNNITIVNNTFKNVHEGVIIHATSGDYWVHGDTYIKGNTFEDAYGTLPYPMYPKAFAQVSRNNITYHGQMYGWGCVFKGNFIDNVTTGAYVGALDFDKTSSVNATRNDSGYTAASDVGLMNSIIENNVFTNVTLQDMAYGPTANYTLFRNNRPSKTASRELGWFNLTKTTDVYHTR
jgi:hypothetical protein